jgi:hypothetical protein
MRINRAIHEGKTFVGGDLSKERLNTEPGLSVFSKNKERVSSIRSTRTFESILKEHNRHNTSESLMEEVEDLKNKLASKKVYASLSQL